MANNEVYTSEEKVLKRLDVTFERAQQLLKEAGYPDLTVARDALGRNLPYQVGVLDRIAKIEAQHDREETAAVEQSERQNT